ncbi:MAG TPA: alpha/beta hydrolase [Actinomycetota bacterium]|nr:alpha/beta hydrolase [Actinomycetota bacterium]
MPAALAAALAATLFTVPPATATAPSALGTGSAAVPELDWGSCAAEGEGLEAFQCASAVVPLDYDKPKGRQVTLALARLPASDPGRKIGSLFLNPGGPGGSGVDFLFGAGPFLYSDEVRARFDLVGFDPRGIIRSTPLRCYETFDEAIADLAPFQFPVTREEERVWIRSDRAIARACAERGGPILDHMSTANVARDMDLLRRAVGDARLTYAGYSYGSYLGSTYANLFPNKVRALVVDGVLDPVAWSTGRGDQARTLPFTTRLRSAKGAYATLQEFLRLCDAGGPNCAFSEGNPKRRFDRLARRLLREPVEFTDPESGETILVTYAELIGATLGVLYDPSVWPLWAEILQQLDELSSPATAAADLKALRVRLGARFQQEPYPNFVEGFPGVACSETHNPSNVGAWARAARAQDRQFPYFGRPWTWFGSICQPWPGWDDDHYDGPFTRTTANPVLVVGNLFDPATPYHGAVTVDRLLPRSRLLTLAGWGHTSLFVSSCVDAYVSTYFLTTRMPPKGTVCEPDLVPFAQPAATAQAQQPTGASAKAELIPPMLRRMLTD